MSGKSTNKKSGGEKGTNMLSSIFSSNNEKKSQVREIFSLVDKDGGGTLTKEELHDLISTLSSNGSDSNNHKNEDSYDGSSTSTSTKSKSSRNIETMVDRIMNDIDKDNDGEIDFNEFLSLLMSRKLKTDYTKEEIKDAFRVFESIHPPSIERQNSYTSILRRSSSSSSIKSSSHRPQSRIHLDSIMIALTEYGKNKMSNEKAKELLQNVETDRNGYVSYADYVDIIMSSY